MKLFLPRSLAGPIHNSGLMSLLAHWQLVFCATGIIIATWLRLAPLLEKEAFWADEVDSYLAATGHLGEFWERYGTYEAPYNQWVQVAEWKRLLLPTPEIGLAQIARDIAQWDLHPPLYFLLLNIWTRAFGIAFWAGPLLNLIFDVVTAVLMWRFVINILDGRADRQITALWVTTLWALQLVPLRTSTLTRQYALLTLCAILFAWLLYRLLYCADSGRARHRELLLLTTASLVGLFTHYLFGAFLLTSGLVLCVQVTNRMRRTTALWIIATLVTAAALFLLLFSPIWNSYIITYITAARDPIWINLPQRIVRMLFINVLLLWPLLFSAGFFYISQFLQSPRTTAFVPHGAAGIAPLRLRPPHGQPAQSGFRSNNAIIYLASFALVPLLVVNLIYLLKIGPSHAMSAQYVAFCAPFVLILCVAARPIAKDESVFFGRRQTYRLPEMRSRLHMHLLFIVSILGALLLHYPGFLEPAYRQPVQMSIPAHANFVVFDNPSPGIWANIVLQLEEEDTIFAAFQEILLQNPDEWLRPLTTQGGLYISYVDIEGKKQYASLEARQAILAQIEQLATVTPVAVLNPLKTADVIIFQVKPNSH